MKPTDEGDLGRQTDSERSARGRAAEDAAQQAGETQEPLVRRADDRPLTQDDVTRDDMSRDDGPREARLDSSLPLEREPRQSRPRRAGGRSAAREPGKDGEPPLVSTGEIAGARVEGLDGRAIGRMDHLMVEPMSGRVTHAVVALHGPSEPDERLHPLPWRMLRFDPQMGGWRATLTRRQLDGAPHSLSEEPRWADPAWRRRIDAHFRVGS